MITIIDSLEELKRASYENDTFLRKSYPEEGFLRKILYFLQEHQPGQGLLIKITDSLGKHSQIYRPPAQDHGSWGQGLGLVLRVPVWVQGLCTEQLAGRPQPVLTPPTFYGEGGPRSQ